MNKLRMELAEELMHWLNEQDLVVNHDIGSRDYGELMTAVEFKHLVYKKLMSVR